MRVESTVVLPAYSPLGAGPLFPIGILRDRNRLTNGSGTDWHRQGSGIIDLHSVCYKAPLPEAFGTGLEVQGMKAKLMASTAPAPAEMQEKPERKTITIPE